VPQPRSLPDEEVGLSSARLHVGPSFARTLLVGVALHVARRGACAVRSPGRATRGEAPQAHRPGALLGPTTRWTQEPATRRGGEPKISRTTRAGTTGRTPPAAAEEAVTFPERPDAGTSGLASAQAPDAGRRRRGARQTRGSRGRGESPWPRSRPARPPAHLISRRRTRSSCGLGELAQGRRRLDAPPQEAARAELVASRRTWGWRTSSRSRPASSGRGGALEGEGSGEGGEAGVRRRAARAGLPVRARRARRGELRPLAHGRLGLLSEVQAALGAQLRDPRYLRSALADVAAAAIFAFMATARPWCSCCSSGARATSSTTSPPVPQELCEVADRRVRAAAARPALVFPAGLAPALLVLFAAVALHLSAASASSPPRSSRCSAWSRSRGGWSRARRSRDQGEDVWTWSAGGWRRAPPPCGSPPGWRAGAPVTRSLFALARYEMRRRPARRVHRALQARRRPPQQRRAPVHQPRQRPDGEGRRGRRRGALQVRTQADPSFAAAFYNASACTTGAPPWWRTIRSDRARQEPHRAVHGAEARRVLLFRKDPPEDNLLHNRLLISPGLSTGEIAALALDPERGQKVTAQLALALTGTARDPGPTPTRASWPP